MSSNKGGAFATGKEVQIVSAERAVDSDEEDGVGAEFLGEESVVRLSVLKRPRKKEKPTRQLTAREPDAAPKWREILDFVNIAPEWCDVMAIPLVSAEQKIYRNYDYGSAPHVDLAINSRYEIKPGAYTRITTGWILMPQSASIFITLRMHGVYAGLVCAPICIPPRCTKEAVLMVTTSGSSSCILEKGTMLFSVKDSMGRFIRCVAPSREQVLRAKEDGIKFRPFTGSAALLAKQKLGITTIADEVASSSSTAAEAKPAAKKQKMMYK